MSNHQSDIVNKNIGTLGTNKTLDQNQGNRGKQIQQQQEKRQQQQKSPTKKK